MFNSSLTQLGAALRAKQISSVELTQSYLDRIAAHNPVFNAYTTVDAKVSLAQAPLPTHCCPAGRHRR